MKLFNVSVKDMISTELIRLTKSRQNLGFTILDTPSFFGIKSYSGPECLSSFYAISRNEARGWKGIVSKYECLVS